MNIDFLMMVEIIFYDSFFICMSLQTLVEKFEANGNPAVMFHEFENELFADNKTS